MWGFHQYYLMISLVIFFYLTISLPLRPFTFEETWKNIILEVQVSTFLKNITVRLECCFRVNKAVKHFTDLGWAVFGHRCAERGPSS